MTSTTSRKRFKGKGMVCYVSFLFATTTVHVWSAWALNEHGAEQNHN